jgi:hypothetical protein
MKKTQLELPDEFWTKLRATLDEPSRPTALA